MKKISILFFLFFAFCTTDSQYNLRSVTVEEFREFVEDSDYVTDAEKYGWSIVQKDVYNYEIVYGADWRTPDGINNSIDNLPVTQVSYNDAVEYSKWAGVRLPTYDQYWEIVDRDNRLIVSDNLYPISPVAVSYTHLTLPTICSV